MTEQEGCAPAGGVVGRIPFAFAKVHVIQRPPRRGSKTPDEFERVARIDEPA